MHFSHQLFAASRLRVTLLPVLLMGLLSACSTLSPTEHNAKVASLRARTPYVTRIGPTHSMSTIVPAGSTAMVRPEAYHRLQAGKIGVFWPIGSPTPVAHFLVRRIGTDSWETAGMNQPGDLTYLGYLLTRENYIGVIY